MINPLVAEEEFNQTVHLQIRARVAGTHLSVQKTVLQGVYNDPEARKAIEAELRYRFMVKILERWTPVIRVHRD